jgi:hypothetical protein
MHALQPMQREGSKSTIPSLRRYIAATGQTATQGGLSQWLQRVTWKHRRVLGNSPLSTHRTQVRNTPRGTWFSDLQATEQAWQPMHLRLSITKP